MARRGRRKSRKASPEERAAADEERRRNSIGKLEQFEVPDLEGVARRRSGDHISSDMHMLDEQMYEQKTAAVADGEGSTSRTPGSAPRRRGRKGKKGTMDMSDEPNVKSDSALDASGNLESTTAAEASSGDGTAAAFALDSNEMMLERMISTRGAGKRGGGNGSSFPDNNTSNNVLTEDKRRHSFDGATAIANEMESYEFNEVELYGDDNADEQEVVEVVDTTNAAAKNGGKGIGIPHPPSGNRRTSWMESVVLEPSSKSDKLLETQRRPSHGSMHSMDLAGNESSLSSLGIGSISDKIQSERRMSTGRMVTNERKSSTRAPTGAADAVPTTARLTTTRSQTNTGTSGTDDISSCSADAPIMIHHVAALPSPEDMPNRSLTHRVKSLFSGKLRRVVPLGSPSRSRPSNKNIIERRTSNYTPDEENALSDFYSDAASVAAALELEGTISSTISHAVHRGSAALRAPMMMVASLAVLLLSLPVVYVPPPLTPASPPAWQPLLTIGVPIIEFGVQILFLIAALVMASAAGSDLGLYFVRHCSFYLALVGLAYLSADIAYLSQVGLSGDGSSQGAERIFRMVTTSLLALSSMWTLYTLERHICRGVERLASASALEAHSDAEIEQYFGNRDPKAEERHLQKRVRSKVLLHTFLSTAIFGLQGLAMLMTARATATYMLGDLGMAEDSTRTRRILLDAGEPETLLDIELSLQGGNMVLSLIESIGVFMHSGFVLSLFSATLLSPHNIGLVGISAFAALGRLMLSGGYVVNLLWSVRSLSSAEIWSLSLIGMEAACCALVMVAAVAWTPLAREMFSMFRKRAPEHQGDASLDQYNETLQSKTLYTIAFPTKADPRPNIWAKILYLSSVAALTIYTIQGVLLLDYHTSLYNNHYIVDVVKYGMVICFIYAFINYVSVAREGEFYSTSRLGIVFVALGSIALSIWQLLSLLIGCAYQAMTPVDAFVMALLGAAICTNFAMLVAALALSDIHTIHVPSSASSTSDNLSARAMASKAAPASEHLCPPPMQCNENKLRKRALIALCFYIPSVLAYSLCLAIFAGHDDLTEESLPLSTTEVEAPQGLNEAEDKDFVFVVNLPGLQVLFHFGLIFVIFCADGIRKKPSMSISLSTASLLSFHAFSMLTIFLVFVFNNGLEKTIYEHSLGQLVEAGAMLVWFSFLIPLSLSLHMLWEHRNKQKKHRSQSFEHFSNTPIKAAPFHEVAIRSGGHFELDLL